MTDQEMSEIMPNWLPPWHDPEDSALCNMYHRVRFGIPRDQRSAANVILLCGNIDPDRAFRRLDAMIRKVNREEDTGIAPEFTRLGHRAFNEDDDL